MGPEEILTHLLRHMAWKIDGTCRWAGVLGKSACEVACEVAGWAGLGLEDSRQEYRDAAWAAPPTAANAPIFQDLSDMPMPFQKMPRPKCPPAVRQVASEFICHNCSREINVWRPLRRQHRVFCVMCNAPYHEACMGEGAKDGSVRGPCCPKE